jgi:DNA-binding CsgD family transcriptional regulator
MMNMFLLPPRLRRLFERNKGLEDSRRFLQEQEKVAIIEKLAKEQGRSEEEVIADFTQAGWDQFLMENDLEEDWNSLSNREQEVVALACLGHRNYEIAEILSIAPETVKTHLQNIFGKFKMHGRRELRLALKNWDFARWWEDTHN